jgi:hypothetical protein
MPASDGIQIWDKPTWAMSWRELWAVLGKRVLSLPAKLLGFKPFCLYVATWLLIRGLIRDWIWFAVMVMVLFGVVGLKVIAGYRDLQHPPLSSPGGGGITFDGKTTDTIGG